LGFLNPLLYKMAQQQPNAFTDVTSSNNKATEVFECAFGWNAATGWDPVTGVRLLLVLCLVVGIDGFLPS